MNSRYEDIPDGHFVDWEDREIVAEAAEVVGEGAVNVDGGGGLEDDAPPDDSAQNNEEEISREYLDRDDLFSRNTVIARSRLDDYYEDDEDLEAFASISTLSYIREIVPLKNKLKPSFSFHIDGTLERAGHERLGHFLRDADHLIEIEFTVSVETDFSLIFKGPFSGMSNLKKFTMRFALPGCMPVRRENATYIFNFIGMAPFISYIQFHGFDFLDRGLKNLAYSLKNAKLEHLKLSQMFARDQDIGDFLSLLDPSCLASLALDDCSMAEKATCEAISTNFLRDSKSKMSELYLRHCRLDDECVSILVKHLATNKRLSKLALSENYRITEDGWKSFDSLVFDTSTMDTIFDSNHSLKFVLGYPKSLLLKSSLTLNKANLAGFGESSTKTLWLRRRKKILKKLVNEDDVFDMNPFHAIEDVTFMPHVLAFVAKQRPQNARSEDNDAFLGLANCYQVVREWKLPALFSFPTREKVLYKAKIEEMEKKMLSMQTENENLVRENLRLRSKVEELEKRNNAV